MEKILFELDFSYLLASQGKTKEANDVLVVILHVGLEEVGYVFS